MGWTFPSLRNRKAKCEEPCAEEPHPDAGPGAESAADTEAQAAQLNEVKEKPKETKEERKARRAKEKAAKRADRKDARFKGDGKVTEKERSEKLKAASIICTVVILLTGILPSFADPQNRNNVGFIGKFVLFVFSGVQAYYCCKKTLGPKTAEICLSGMLVALLLMDWESSALQGARWWVFGILVLDALLVVDGNQKLCFCLVVMVQLWIIAERSEAVALWGLWSASRWGSHLMWAEDGPLISQCDCGRPPCAVGALFAVPQLAGWMLLFTLDFFLTRRFSNKMRAENERIRESVKLAEAVATCLVRYDIIKGKELLHQGGSVVPGPMRYAFEGLLRNLGNYRPFLPPSVLPQESLPDDTAPMDRDSPGLSDVLSTAPLTMDAPDIPEGSPRALKLKPQEKPNLVVNPLTARKESVADDDDGQSSPGSPRTRRSPRRSSAASAATSRTARTRRETVASSPRHRESRNSPAASPAGRKIRTRHAEVIDMESRRRSTRASTKTGRTSMMSSASGMSSIASPHQAPQRKALDVGLAKKQVSIVTCNVTGYHATFNAASQQKEMVKFQSLYVTMMVKLAGKGVLGSVHGDHATVQFNAARPLVAHRAGACDAALSCSTSVGPDGKVAHPEVQKLRDQANQPELNITAGASTGDALVGAIGSDTLKTFSVISTVYPFAAALERVAAAGWAYAAVDPKIAERAEALGVTSRPLPTKMLFRKYHVTAPMKTQGALIYSLEYRKVADVGGGDDDEWMYMLEQQRDANPFRVYTEVVMKLLRGECNASRKLADEEAGSMTRVPASLMADLARRIDWDGGKDAAGKWVQPPPMELHTCPPGPGEQRGREWDSAAPGEKGLVLLAALRKAQGGGDDDPADANPAETLQSADGVTEVKDVTPSTSQDAPKADPGLEIVNPLCVPGRSKSKGGSPKGSPTAPLSPDSGTELQKDDTVG